MLFKYVFIVNRPKTENETVYYNVDYIHTAIYENKEIKFHYAEWTVKKELKLKKDGAFYVVSPWALTWDDENYYLVAYDAAAGIIKHYRVDEIMVEVSKRDWKLFREKLPGWQESYMERLCKEYVELLTCDKKGSERFWALEERIKKDRKAPSVILSVSKSDMLIDLVRLVQDEVIGLGDLSDFSEDVQERVKFMVQRW